MLINKRERVDLKHCYDSKTFNEYLNGMDDVYENIDENNPKKKKKCKILMIKVLDDKIADMSSNKKLNPTVT